MEEFNFEILVIKWYKFFKKNTWFIMLFSLMGATGGLIYAKWKAPVYRSNGILHSNLISKNRLSSIIEDIGFFVNKRSDTALSSMLGMTSEEVASIRSIEIEDLNSEMVKTSIEYIFNDFEDNCIRINLRVEDPTIILKFQSGITNYVSNNEFLRKISDFRKQNLEKMIKKIDEQILSLEKFQRTSISSLESRGEGFILSNEPHTSSIDLMLLMQKKSNYEEIIAMNSVEFIKPFYQPDKPESKLIIFIAAGLIFGFIIGLSIALLRKVNSLV